MLQVSLSEFADSINDLMPLLAREFARHQTNDELYKGKITLQQFLVLAILDKEGQTKMKNLAQFMHVTTADMTGLVERLVKSGYVVRVFLPEDRRVIKIQLTPEGRGLVKRVTQEKKKMVMRIFGKISEQDRQDYLGILERIKDTLIKESSLTP